jgi:serine/threonine-protein kinase
MLCPQGESRIVKVLDFGLARVAASTLTRGGAMPGSPSYMSPEQCRGQEVDARSDIYSLGCVLFACVATRPPFQGREPVQVMRAQVQDPPPDPRRLATEPISEGFAQTLLDCLAKDPAERPQTAAALKERLEHLRPRAARPARPEECDLEDPTIQARVLATLAERAERPSLAFELARLAMQLDPRDLTYRRLVRLTQARLRPSEGEKEG